MGALAELRFFRCPTMREGLIASMKSVARYPIPIVVSQHVEGAAALRSTRTHLVSAFHVKLRHLGRLDERLAAHLDGVAVAGDCGAQLADAALESPGVGQVFVAAINAIERKQSPRLDRLIALVEAVPDAQSGLTSAFGWVSALSLQGTIKQLLSSHASLRQHIAIATCAMHRVDPAKALEAGIQDPDVALRARSLRAAGELVRRDLVSLCERALKDENTYCRFWAAWAAVVMGDRRGPLDVLKTIARFPGPLRDRALELALKVMELQDTHALLQTLAPDPNDKRVLIQGSGIAGDPHYVLWLIKQMDDPKVSRIAGESFSLITGVDLAHLDLDQKPPEDVELGPTDDPEDEDVTMDPDGGLPWPDRVKIQGWWDTNKHRFQPGVRYFMGESVNVKNCKRVLREGYQRQRIAAALYLSLLEPGTPLFPTSAPAWRQQRLLAKMT